VADPSAEAVAGVTVNSLTSAVTFVYPLSESPAFILYSSSALPLLLVALYPSTMLSAIALAFARRSVSSSAS